MSSARERLRGPALAALVLVAAVMLRAFVFGLVRIETGSMEPTLHVGDVVLYNRLASPQPGDLVVLAFPDEPGVLHVKRLIADGPAEVELSEGRLYVDGEPRFADVDVMEWPDPTCALREHAVITETDGSRSWTVVLGGDHGRRTVAGDEVWVMGDRRPSSTDSRQWGPLRRSLVVGTAVRVAWPSASCEHGGRRWLRSLGAQEATK